MKICNQLSILTNYIEDNFAAVYYIQKFFTHKNNQIIFYTYTTLQGSVGVYDL